MNQTRNAVALLLEDEPLIALDVEDALRSTGFDVVTVGSCTQADAWLLVNTPTVAVIDLELVDGECRNAAEQLYRRGVPFIVHTGREKSPSTDGIFEHGHWLAKPAASDALALLSRALADASRSDLATF